MFLHLFLREEDLFVLVCLTPPQIVIFCILWAFHLFLLLRPSGWGGGGLVQSEPFNQPGKECYFHGSSEVWLAGREGELIH